MYPNYDLNLELAFPQKRWLISQRSACRMWKLAEDHRMKIDFLARKQRIVNRFSLYPKGKGSMFRKESIMKLLPGCLES